MGASSSEEEAVEDAEDANLEAGLGSMAFAAVTRFFEGGLDSSSELPSRVASSALILERGVSGVPGGEDVLTAGDDRRGEEAIAVLIEVQTGNTSNGYSHWPSGYHGIWLYGVSKYLAGGRLGVLKGWEGTLKYGVSGELWRLDVTRRRVWRPRCLSIRGCDAMLQKTRFLWGPL